MKNILKNINLIDGFDNLYSLGGFDIYAQPAHRTEIVFIESNVPDYQQLISGLSADKEYFVLDAQSDGLERVMNFPLLPKASPPWAA